MSVRYPNVTSMRAQPTSGLSADMSHTAYVADLNDFFKFVRGSTTPDVANIVVSSNDALGKWHRMGIPPQTAPGGVHLYDATGTATAYAPVALGRVLTDNGPGLQPTWQALPEKYLGAPMLRSYLPNDTGVTNSILNMMSLSQHTMGDDLAAAQFALPNFIGHLEGGPGSATTVTASIEFETGFFWKFTFNGSGSGSIPNAGMIWTDPMPWTIPRGTRFGFRCYRTNVSGCPFALTAQNPGIGERIEYNVGSDKTLGGTISSVDATNWYGPAGARGLMTKPSVAIIGDSISLGQYDTNDSTGATGGIARALQAAGTAYTQLSVGSTTAQSFLLGYTNKIALASLCSHVIITHGTNDIGLSGRTDAQIRADLLSIVALLPAAQKKYIATMTPRTTGSWANLAGQSLTAFQATMDANNTWRRTVPTGFTACIDINSAVEVSGTGKWKFPNYTGDGLHPSATGYAAIRDSGVIPVFVRP